MGEFDINGNTYRIGKLNAFQQFDVARRFSTVLVVMGSMLAPDDAEPNKPRPTAAAFARAICTFARSVSQADSDFVVNLCMSIASRKQPNDVGWQPVRAASGQIMFDDIDMDVMLQIVWRVMEAHNMPDFFSVAPAASGATTGAA